MIWEINKNVFWVPGAKNSLIYDLRSKFAQLFWLDKELTSIIRNYVASGKPILGDNSVLRLLEENSLLSKSRNFRILDQKVSNIPFKIRFAWIELTRYCNLKCIHCYSKCDSNERNFISLQDFQVAIDNLEDIGCRRVQLTGGEPLLHPNFYDFVHILSKRNFEVEIFTNATLFTKSLLNFLKKNGVKVAISILGDKKSVDTITQVPGTFSKQMSAINKMKNSKLKFRVCTSIMSLNSKKIPELGNIPVRKTYVRLTGRANLSLIDFETFKRKAIKKETFQKEMKSSYIYNNFFFHQCFSKKIYISSNLDVFPCVMERRVRYGNLRNDSLKQVLYRNTHYATLTKDKITVCKSCEFRYACFDCRPDSLSMNFFEKPWYCTYDPINGKFESLSKFYKSLKEN